MLHGLGVASNSHEMFRNPTGGYGQHLGTSSADKHQRSFNPVVTASADDDNRHRSRGGRA